MTLIQADTGGTVLPGLTFPEYLDLDGVNSSTLKELRRSPLHCFWRMNHSRSDTAPLALGRAVHTALLEPADFSERYAVAPKVDRRTKAGKAAWADFQEQAGDRELLGTDDAETVDSIAQAVTNDGLASSLLDMPGQSEVSIVWNDAATGLRCKARLDRYAQDSRGPVIIDVKTTRSITPDGFARDAARYGYHLQAAYYCRAVRSLEPGRSPRLLFLVVETLPPFAVAVYRLGVESFARGENLADELLDKYAACEAAGVWPGPTTSVQDLELPAWALAGDRINEEADA